MSAPMPLEASPEDWLECAVDQIHHLALTRTIFTADDLRPLICPPHADGQYGAAFRVAQSRRLISYVYHRRSASRSRRGGSLAVWCGHPSIFERKTA